VDALGIVGAVLYHSKKGEGGIDYRMI